MPEVEGEQRHCYPILSTTDVPSREVLHMMSAMLWSKRSRCKRAQVGCVVTTDKLQQVLAIGYNGPARFLPNDRCRGEPGTCGCLHAEMNAIAFVNSYIPHKVMFTTCAPCEICAQLIVQSGFSRVYYFEEYRSEQGVLLLRDCSILAISLSMSQRLQMFRKFVDEQWPSTLKRTD